MDQSLSQCPTTKVDHFKEEEREAPYPNYGAYLDLLVKEGNNSFNKKPKPDWEMLIMIALIIIIVGSELWI